MARDNCPLCGEEMELGQIKVELEKLNFASEGWICPKCGNEVFNRAQAKRLVEKVIRKLK